MLLYIVTKLPIVLISQFVPDSKVIFLLRYFINPNVFLISSTSYFNNILDRLFLFNLKFIDDTNGSAYYTNFASLTNEDIYLTKSFFPLYKQFKEHMKNSEQFKSFLRRYVYMLSYNLLVFILVTQQNQITSVFLTFTAFQTFYHKLGPIPSILLIALLNLLPYEYTSIALTSFYACSNMSIDFLLPFINRINPTKLEIGYWMNSRDGVLFGFTLVYFTLMNYFSNYAVVFYMWGQMNTAYLITKLSNSPPPVVSDSRSSLMTWFSTQLIWNNVFSFTSGGFLEDPFVAVPGSFLLE